MTRHCDCPCSCERSVGCGCYPQSDDHCNVEVLKPPVREFRLPALQEPLMSQARAKATGHGNKRMGFAAPTLPILPSPKPIEMLKSPSVMPVPYKDVLNPSTEGKLWSSPSFPIKRGLVLLCHGKNDFISTTAFETVWNYLGNCLAANGFLVASIRHFKDGSGTAADRFINNLKFLMKGLVQKHGALGKPLALLGQSEGAMGAIRAGQRISDGEIAQLFSKVDAVVALAPSISANEPIPDFSESALSMLVLQGTHDGDSPAGGVSLLHYLSSAAQLKSFCWIFGGSHANFLQGAADKDAFIVKQGGFGLRVINPKTQWLITQNYVGMFLLWRLAGQKAFKGLFVGEAAVTWKAGVEKAIQSDLDNEKVRIEPRYDTRRGSFPLSAKSAPAAVHFSGFSTVSTFKPLQILNTSLPHEDTSGFIATWQTEPGDPPPRISVDCDNISTLAKSYAAIEFQAVLVANSALNDLAPPPSPILVSASAVHANGFSKSVQILIEPSLFVPALLASDMSNVSRSMLSTVRIPVLLFGLSDGQLKTVKTFRLVFHTAPTEGAIAITGFRAALE